MSQELQADDLIIIRILSPYEESVQIPTIY